MTATATPRTRATRARMALTMLGVAGALLVPACARLPVGLGGDIPAAPGQQLWRTDGYGRIYTLQGDQLSSYEITEVSCMPGESASRIAAPGGNGALTFGSDGVAEETLRIDPGGKAVFHELGTVSDIDLLPLRALPASCAQRPPKDARTTFDVFWATVAENYNSLQRKHIDWVAERDRYRPMISEETRSKQLFAAMRAMMEPFGDEHTGITTKGDAQFEGKRAGTVDIDAEKTDTAIDHYLLTVGATGYVTFGDGKIVYADLPNGRGYLRIDAFEGLTKSDDWPPAEAEVNRMLSTVFTAQRVAGWRMLIIDLRNNPGGEDQLGVNISARLTDRPYTAYTKAARNDPKDPTKHARTQTVTVTPADAPRYTGPIRLLTGPLTVSAGETFTLGMMARTPAPERFGETTQGVYSDTLERKLPNGWTVTIGNEEYAGPDGKSYEGLGIPPTTPIPVFPPAELAANQDSVLAAALR